MKRTAVYEGEIGGSTTDWPMTLYISKNERSGQFRLYVHFTDPEARSYSVEKFSDAMELRVLLEDVFLDPKDVGQHLSKASNSEISQLGRTLLHSGET